MKTIRKIRILDLWSPTQNDTETFSRSIYYISSTVVDNKWPVEPELRLLKVEQKHFFLLTGQESIFTSSSAMAERPRDACSSIVIVGVGHFEAKFYVEGYASRQYLRTVT